MGKVSILFTIKTNRTIRSSAARTGSFRLDSSLRLMIWRWLRVWKAFSTGCRTLLEPGRQVSITSAQAGQPHFPDIRRADHFSNTPDFILIAFTSQRGMVALLAPLTSGTASLPKRTIAPAVRGSVWRKSQTPEYSHRKLDALEIYRKERQKNPPYFDFNPEPIA